MSTEGGCFLVELNIPFAKYDFIMPINRFRKATVGCLPRLRFLSMTLHMHVCRCAWSVRQARTTLTSPRRASLAQLVQSARVAAASVQQRIIGRMV